MTDIRDFPGFQECDKMDPCLVDAYVEIKADDQNPTGVILESSWGESKLDLKNIIKSGETITHLELAPENSPTVVRYFREDGDIDCITGDELSRIVSMSLLKDVDQNQALEDGDAYVYNATTGLFEPFDIKTAIGDLNTYLNRLNAQLTALTNRVTNLEAKLTPPADAPEDVAVVFGNINHISDVNYTGENTLNKGHGLYTHTLAEDKIDDLVSA